MILRPEIFDYLVDRFTDFYVEYFDRLFFGRAGKGRHSKDRGRSWPCRIGS